MKRTRQFLSSLVLGFSLCACLLPVIAASEVTAAGNHSAASDEIAASAETAAGGNSAASAANAASEKSAASDKSAGRYVFSFPYIVGDAMAPRGGTTRGAPVELVTGETEEFRRVRAPDLDSLERDRRAILAMAGSYRVSFDFLEVVGFSAGYEPGRPYQSWATEHIYVIADDEEHISLQHILVMTVLDEAGEPQGPFVSKHWRQDWDYEAREVHTYRGRGAWERRTARPREVRGHWAQRVWQVDDSPRYAAWGRWEHTPERSTWLSGETWRPLPRREFSVRDDYDVLIGTNRHTILPTGWIQEQRNLKVVLDDTGTIGRRVAKEYGLARYERIRDFDTSEGDAYWTATADFWSEVRAYWDRALAQNDAVRLKSTVNGAKMFEPLFERARAIAGGEDYTRKANARFVRETLDAYRAVEPVADAEY
ncbi:MAG: DUF6607 family protein [Halioglobus sp.]|nr:DUF6607 family protein [Halioglobus sp.]